MAKEMMSAFDGTSLHRKLRQRGAKLVALTGFSFGCCLSASAGEAVKSGKYTTLVLTDGCTASTNDPFRNELARMGAIFTTSRTFLKALALNL